MGTSHFRPDDWCRRYDSYQQPEDGEKYLVAIELHDITTRLNYWSYEQVQAVKTDYGWKFYYSSGHPASFQWEDVGYYMPLADRYA